MSHARAPLAGSLVLLVGATACTSGKEEVGPPTPAASEASRPAHRPTANGSSASSGRPERPPSACKGPCIDILQT
jgi:hypothetical protein